MAGFRNTLPGRQKGETDMNEQNDRTQETVEAEVLPTTEELKQQYAAEMKKYKLSLYVVLASIALYIFGMFFVKNYIFVLACCVPLIAGAVWNSKEAKKIRKINQEYVQVTQMEKNAQAVADGTMAPEEAELLNASSIVANAKSLNDLPKEYTVLDNEELYGTPVAHIILSPYGVALVDATDRTEDMRSLLQEVGVESPVFSYAPGEDVAVLAEQIQMPKNTVLTEKEIYQILYHLRGLD